MMAALVTAAATVIGILGGCTSVSTAGQPSREISADTLSDDVDLATGREGGATPEAAVAEPIEQEENSPFDSDDEFSWLRTSPASIRMVWRDEQGAAYGQLERGRRALNQLGHDVVAIASGGIYAPGLRPLGLYVENGVEMTPLNLAEGSGNFFLQPNGVFSIVGGVAAIDRTAQFSEWHSNNSNQDQIDWALQSGPMLVIDGEANPLFTHSSESTHIRNAVAVDTEGNVVLIRSKGLVTMRQLADRCLELGATDALYLDGTIARLDWVRTGLAVPINIPVATMIAVVE